MTRDQRERGEYEDHGRAQSGDGHKVQTLAPTSQPYDLRRGPRLDAAEEIVDRRHDLGLGTVVLRTVQETTGEFHGWRPLAGELAPVVEKATLDRMHRLRFQSDQGIGATLGLPQERQLIVREVGVAHQSLEGHGLPVASRGLAPRHHEVPVDVAVVERPRGPSVADGEDLVEVGPVARVSRHDIEPGHAGQIVGALAQLVGELVRMIASDFRSCDVALGVPRERNDVQAPCDEDEDCGADNEQPRLD